LSAPVTSLLVVYEPVAALLRFYQLALKTYGDNYFSLVRDSPNHAQIGVRHVGAGLSGAVRVLCTALQLQPVPAGESVQPEHRRVLRSALWQRIDRDVVDQAPWIPLVTPTSFDFVSERVGNYQYSPSGFGTLIDQLWAH
jgi:hypothetical protein